MKTTLQPILTLICVCLLATITFAQIPNGSVAPAFSLTDLDGNLHTLQDYLDEGKTVVIDFSATWCGPCWSYHSTGALANLHAQNGPGGTDEFVVLFIEADVSTEEACLYGNIPGCTSNSQGNWVATTPYPIINVTSNAIPSAYGINAYPTIVTVCPDGLLYESGRASTSTHQTWMSSCTFAADLVSTSGMQCYEEAIGTADVEVSGGLGTAYYQWSNGASTQDLLGVNPGTYSCTATEGNGIERVIQNVVVAGPTTELITTIQNYADVTCHDAENGTINVSTIGGAPDYNFQWSNGQSTEDLNNLGGGIYDLVVTDDNGCFKTLSVEIVNPDVIEADISVTDENCDRSDATLSVQGQGGTGSLSYTFNGLTSVNGTFNNLSSGTSVLSIVDENNCNQEFDVFIDEVPAPDLEVFPAANLDCQTTSMQLAASASVGPNFDYIWTTTNGQILSGELSLSPTIGAPGDYKIVVINATNGCFSEATVTVEGSTDLPIIEIDQPALFGCSTTEVTIDASNSSSGSDYSFVWTTDNGVIVSGEDAQLLVVGASGTYTLTLTNSVSGCSTESSILVEEDSDVPVASIGAPHVIDCDTRTVELDGSASSIGSDIEYIWTTADGEIVSTAGSQASVNAAGTYALTVINVATGCSSDVEITVEDESEYVDATWYYQSSGLSIDIQNLTTGNPNNLVWDMGNGEIIDGELSEYEFGESGIYTICLTATNGCGDDIRCISVEVSDRQDQRDYSIYEVSEGERETTGSTRLPSQQETSNLDEEETKAYVYPNPTSTDFVVAFSIDKMVNSYSVVDLAGQTLFVRQVNKEVKLIEVSTNELLSGTHFIKVQTDDGLMIKPVIIIK